MGLFTESDLAEIESIAIKSNRVFDNSENKSNRKVNSIVSELEDISEQVQTYFKDSPAILITDNDMLTHYIDELIRIGIAGIDTETTGLDRINDYVVGASLYFPGNVECYIPMKHKVPIFDTWYPHQLSYDDVSKQLQRLVDSNTKLIFANADFDLSMIYKDFGVDLCKVFFYDVILAWRCINEGERDNTLKGLYNKYVLEGKGDPKRFSDFFSPEQFPYCNPNVAKLYAANDAKITYELYEYQRQFIDKSMNSDKYMDSISELVSKVEFPLVSVCQNLHRTGIYFDYTISSILHKRYHDMLDAEEQKLCDLIDEFIANSDEYKSKTTVPFKSGKEFNPKSVIHMQFLIYDLLKHPVSGKKSTSGDVLSEMNLPITNQILAVRSLRTIISTFIDKLPNSVGRDGRIHAVFKQIGADTGRFSSADPNMQNIPSHASDIRHLFRATPGYVMLSSDYSAQEPRITAYVSQDKKMIEAFQQGRDIYASIASLSFGVPYEECLEFHPETGEYQPDGKRRRTEAKTIVLGICYGRSVPSIADQLYGKDDTMSKEEKVAKAQYVFDGVLIAFPNLRSLMISSNKFAKEHGYVETILGRRRHIPDMLLPEFEFYPKAGYVNPNIDPLDVSTLSQTNDLSDDVKSALLREFLGYKHWGQIVNRTKELDSKYHIGVVDNRKTITKSSRKVVNSIIQGCLGPEVKIQTKEYGTVCISDTRIAYRDDLSIWDGVGWSKGVVVPSGKKRQCVIKFSVDRQIICSPDHKFLCTQDADDSTEFLTCQEIHDLIDIGRTIAIDCCDKFLIVDSVDITDNFIDMYDICNTDRGQFVADGLITHNSAADQTKLAMLVLSKNKRWNDIGGRLLVPVHDELIAEVPMEHWEEGGRLLSTCMIQAANFLPFDSKCDVTTTLRWYGLEYPCKYPKPNSISTNDVDEIKWIQYQLVEMEYVLPVISEDNNKPIGDAAVGINGIETDEYTNAILDYITTRNIDESSFIDCIENEVLYYERKI